MLKEILEEVKSELNESKKATGKTIPQWVLEEDKDFLWLDLTDDIKKNFNFKKMKEEGILEYKIDGSYKEKDIYRMPVIVKRWDFSNELPLFNTGFIEEFPDYVQTRDDASHIRVLNEEEMKNVNYIKKQSDIKSGNVINVYKV